MADNQSVKDTPEELHKMIAIQMKKSKKSQNKNQLS